MENEKKDFCPVCNKLMRTHTYSDLTDCMEKLFDMIDVSHSNKNQDLSKGVKLGWGENLFLS